MENKEQETYEVILNCENCKMSTQLDKIPKGISVRNYIEMKKPKCENCWVDLTLDLSHEHEEDDEEDDEDYEDEEEDEDQEEDKE